MADAVSLTSQTIYAELTDRCATAAFDAEFPLNGSFVRVRIKERDYWYFQQGARDASGKQPRKYVGPDTPEIQEHIKNHGQAKNDYRERRHLVATLRRSGFQGPSEEAGHVLQALSDAGVFRMRACLVGTAAYQVYGPILGIRLPHAVLRTEDLDIAQFTAISIAIAKDEQTPPLLEILRQADRSFRAVPHNAEARATAAYVNGNGFRVEVLTENRGPERETPARLPAIGTYAQPLRFMDFLIREEIPAAILYDSGVLVNVPSPERYALHKLIVAQRRRAGAAKIDKDIKQAQALIDTLARRRPADLRDAWGEAAGRGPKWRNLLTTGLGMIASKARDQALFVFGASRNIVPGLDLHFADAAPRYDFSREAVTFEAKAGGERVLCAISREALEGHFGADNLTKDQRLDVFRRCRREIQEMARLTYLNRPVPADGAILITTADVPSLRHFTSRGAKKRRKPTR
ncbi:MAG: GSU2403 family nucleotidyltransferase fold protein [Stellaceae bacterium]